MLPIGYHVQHLLIRKTNTILTLLVVAAVVGVLNWMLGFDAALSSSLGSAGDDRKIIVLKRGATSEANSAIPVDEFNLLNQLDAVARDPTTGQPMMSPEMLVQIQVPRRRDGGTTVANVAVRGVTEKAFLVHRTTRLIGPMFSTGEPEVIVGAGAAKQFSGLEVGQTVNLGFGNDRTYLVVGTFSADGGPLESEIWGYLPALMSAYNRTMYSSVNLRLKPEANVEAVLEQIRGPAIQLEPRTEAAYWEEQSSGIRVYLGMAYGLVTVMALAAAFAMANTMYAAVAGRTREIAMLRTIGFRGWQILSGFVLEAVLLALMGGAVGCAACWGWLTLVGNTKDMFGANTFTTLAFEIRFTPAMAAETMGWVILVGAVGAMFPAVRAARVQVLAALREA